MEKKTLGEPRQGGWKSGCDLGTKVLTAKKKKKKKSSCPTQPCHGGGLKVPFGNECNVSCEPSCSPGNYCFFTFVWQEASGRISMGEQFPVCMTDCSERKGQFPPLHQCPRRPVSYDPVSGTQSTELWRPIKPWRFHASPGFAVECPVH